MISVNGTICQGSCSHGHRHSDTKRGVDENWEHNFIDHMYLDEEIHTKQHIIKVTLHP